MRTHRWLRAVAVVVRPEPELPDDRPIGPGFPQVRLRARVRRPSPARTYRISDECSGDGEATSEVRPLSGRPTRGRHRRACESGGDVAGASRAAPAAAGALPIAPAACIQRGADASAARASARWQRDSARSRGAARSPPDSAPRAQ